MDPALHELFAEGLPEDEIAVVLRLVDPRFVPDGIRVVTQFGHIVTCRLRRADIPAVRAQPQVASMKRPRHYSYPWPETEVASPFPENESTSKPDWSDQRRPEGDLPTGEGVVVAHIDWGIDFAHPDFRNPDGTTRVLALWDQSRLFDPTWPNPYGYGRIYDAVDINRALATPDPYTALGYHPAASDSGRGSHGTHTTGISAGNGRSGGPVGLAPQASIVFVHLSTAAAEDPSLLPSEAELVGNLGDSVGFLEALDFIKRTAGERPVVINASVGRIAGEHDGFALTEQGMDAFLCAGPGTAISNSAGNYFDRDAHACGELKPGREESRRFIVAAGASLPTEVDLWYPGVDRFEVVIRPPGSDTEIRAIPGQRVSVKIEGREVGRLYHRICDPNNGDNEVTLFLDPGTSAGEWELRLSGLAVVDGRFHVWIERTAAKPAERSRFHKDDSDPTTTLGTICNGFRTIAVGAYDAQSMDRPLARFSSCGPDRYGRPKPDLVAPGVNVLAARSHPRDKDLEVPLQTRMSGTSMAAPHVAGTIALIFAAAGRPLTIDETRALLLANTDPAPPAVDRISRFRLGSGYLNTEAAVAGAQRIKRSAVELGEMNNSGASDFSPRVEQSTQTQATNEDYPMASEDKAEHAARNNGNAESRPLNIDAAQETAEGEPSAGPESFNPRESEAEALSRRDGLGRASSGSGLPFQFQIPITGGPPALALPIGGSASPFAFTVPLGGTPAPAAPATPAAAAPPVPPPTPSELPPVMVASTDTPIQIPAIDGYGAQTGLGGPPAAYDGNGFRAAAAELLDLENVFAPETPEQAAASAEIYPDDRPFGDRVLEIAESLSENASGGSQSSSILDALARGFEMIGNEAESDEDSRSALFGVLPRPTATTLFNSFVNSPEKAVQFAQRLFVVVRPNEIIHELQLRPGDIFLRVARGEGWGRIGIVASPGLHRRENLADVRLRGEGYPLLLPGHYAHVIEPCTSRGTAAVRFARRITDEQARVLPDTLILRIVAPAIESIDPEPSKNGAARSDQTTSGHDATPVLRKGDSGSAVSRAQRRLNRIHADAVALGLPGLPGSPLPDNGRFDSRVEQAVIALQQQLFSDPFKWDGVIGKETWRQLNLLAGANGPQFALKGDPPQREPNPDLASKGEAEAEDAEGAFICESESAEGEVWTGSDVQIEFRERVLEEHIARTRRRKGFPQRDLTDGELKRVEGTPVKMRTDAAMVCGELIANANRDLESARLGSDPDAALTIRITAASGYRSADDQRRVWREHFAGYYNQTRSAREDLAGGMHSATAVAYMLETFKIPNRVAAPGYSNHQGGIAIDFQQVRVSGHRIANSYEATEQRKWRASWFFQWLGQNAQRWKFEPYEKEAWHWEYKPLSAANPDPQRSSPALPALARRSAALEADGSIADRDFLGGRLWTFTSNTLPGLRVAAFCSKAGLAAQEVEVLLYAHGLIHPCPPVPRQPEDLIVSRPFRLGEKIDAAGRAMVLVVPFLRWEHMTGDFAFGPRKRWHALAQPQNINTLVDEVLESLGRVKAGGPPTLRNLLIAGHSRAYDFLDPIAHAYADTQMQQGALAKLSEVWALDTSYSCPIDDWKRWIRSNPRLRVNITFRTGSSTAACGEQFKSGLRGNSRVNIVELDPLIKHCDVPGEMLPRLLAPGSAGEWAQATDAESTSTVLADAQLPALVAEQSAGFTEANQCDNFIDPSRLSWPRASADQMVPAPDTAELESVDQIDLIETAITQGRLELSNTPLLASHRGTQPDLILRWNNSTDPSAVDTVVHLHGYSSDRQRMSLRNKEAYSGLDFSNPDDASDARPGRTRPTLGILPRGSYEGDHPSANPERYAFPALAGGSGLANLISYSLGQFASTTGSSSELPAGRMISTAHSGGGAALMRILAHANPDEIYCFDALYTDASPLIAWLTARINAEVQSWTADKTRAEGGLCVLYRRGGTQAQSLRVNRAIRTAIAAAPSGAQGPLAAAYRVLRTTVAHGEIPRRFGWLLLSDVAQPLTGTVAAESEDWNEGEEFAEAVNRGSSDYLRWVQTSLNQIDSAGLAVDGIHGTNTKTAVRSFQTRHALEIDGTVGPQTEAEMIAEGAPRPPGYSLCAVSSLGIVDPTALNISPVGEKDYDAGTFTASTGRVLHIRGNVVYPATTNGSGQPFNPGLGGLAPIIFMAHGNHAIAFDPADRTNESCGDPGHVTLPNHKGYIYFQELLAGMGIVSVSVDCNETNCLGLSSTNINERAELIVASIRHFQSLNSGGDAIFGGRIDFGRVALFGHSRGAEAVLVVPELTGSRAPAAATIIAVLSLAPTETGASSGAPRGYTFMTILPAADGDVVPNFGAKYYDQATPHPLKTQVYVYEANHNFFNREWVSPDVHSGAGPLTRVEHERLLNVFGSAFFREVFFTHGFRNLLVGKEIPPAARTGKVHVSAEFDNPLSTVDDYENHNIALNTLGQTVTLTGFTTADEFPFSRTVGAFNDSFFGNTNGLVLRRSSATNRLRSPLNAPLNLTGKEIWLRVAEVYQGNVPRGRTGFRIGLEDARGRTAFVDSNEAGTVPRPFDRKADDAAHFGTDFTKTIPETFRFPAGCFRHRGVFDITKIQAIHLQLNRNDGRPIAFDQLQII